MPWVRLDDRFPSHRKVALLSDRAFRLYVSALCWCSENLTEGTILDRELTVITRIRGLKAAATDLEKAGLWDRIEGGWQVHDYLEYNPDRAKVQAEREANAARQKAFRDRKKAEREAKRNGVTPDGQEPRKRTSATPTRHDDDTTTHGSHSQNHASPQVETFRNGVSNGTPVPSPSPYVPPTEVRTDCEPAPDQLPMIGTRPRIPANCRPLVDALTAANMAVGWDLGSNDWILIEALIKRCGIPMLATHAASQWQGARQRPRSGSYFIPGWRTLPDAPAVGTSLQLAAPAGPPTPNQMKRHLFGEAAAQLAGGQ